MDKALTPDKINEMTRKELCAFIGIAENQLLMSSYGLVDIMGVCDGKVSYGFLSKGRIMTEGIDEFLARFENSELVNQGNEYGKVMGNSDRLK